MRIWIFAYGFTSGIVVAAIVTVVSHIITHG